MQVTEVLPLMGEAKVWPWVVDVVHPKVVAPVDFNSRLPWRPTMLERALRDNNLIFSGEGARMAMAEHLQETLKVIGDHKAVTSHRCRNSNPRWAISDTIRTRMPTSSNLDTEEEAP